MIEQVLTTPNQNSEKNNHFIVKKEKHLLTVRNLKKHFVIKGIRGSNLLYALNDISFKIKHGETFGLVGESGSGKSTTSRIIIQLEKATSGHVFFDGVEISKLNKQQMVQKRKDLQMVFQDPFSSLNPRMTIGKMLSEPFIIFNIGNSKTRKNDVLDLLDLVGLNKDFYERYPHELSGGQRQRIGIARAISLRPKFIICDEPVSALDVSVQSQILNLLEKLQCEFGITYLFIAHSLNVIRFIADTVGVMYLGKILETGATEELFENPFHPYTEALISANPAPNPHNRGDKKIILKGETPSPIKLPSGCFFHERCRYCQEICTKEEPPEYVFGTRKVLCHFPLK